VGVVVKSLIGYALALLVLLALCGHAMQVTGKDNACSAVGGQLNWAEECTKDGQVIKP
jgi:hypothetical protein